MPYIVGRTTGQRRVFHFRALKHFLSDRLQILSLAHLSQQIVALLTGEDIEHIARHAATAKLQLIRRHLQRGNIAIARRLRHTGLRG